MRYTKPTIQNETKATTQIMGGVSKFTQTLDNLGQPMPHIRTTTSAYEADE